MVQITKSLLAIVAIFAMQASAAPASSGGPAFLKIFKLLTKLPDVGPIATLLSGPGGQSAQNFLQAASAKNSVPMAQFLEKAASNQQMNVVDYVKDVIAKLKSGQKPLDVLTGVLPIKISAAPRPVNNTPVAAVPVAAAPVAATPAAAAPAAAATGTPAETDNDSSDE